MTVLFSLLNNFPKYLSYKIYLSEKIVLIIYRYILHGIVEANNS